MSTNQTQAKSLFDSANMTASPDTPAPSEEKKPAKATKELSIDDLVEQLMATGVDPQQARKLITKAAAKKSKGNRQRRYAEIDFEPLTVHLNDVRVEEAWDKAISHVTMPIQFRKAKFQLEDEDTPREAVYDTDSGRNGTFYFVAVDRNRTGNWKALSPSTEMYAAIPPATVYESLREFFNELNDVEYRIVSCYNSFTGGRHDLRIEITGLDGMKKGTSMSMEMVLQTSLDRSKNHVLHARPVADDGTPIYFMDTNNNAIGLKTRHTKSATQKVVDFNAAVTEIVKHWNETIVPYMQFLNDGEFSEKQTYALLKGIVEDAKLPPTTVESLKHVNPKKAGTNPMNGIKEICSMIESTESPIARSKQSEAVGKAIAKRVAALYDRMSK